MVSILLFSILISLARSEHYYFKPDKRVVESADVFVAEAFHNNTANTTGWIFLKIVGSAQFSDEEQFYAAGYLEGYLTYQEIFDAYRNFVGTVRGGQHYLPKSIRLYVESQYAWMKEQAKQQDPIWNQVRMLLIQLEAMYDGYVARTQQTHQELSFWQFYYLSNMGDLNDLVPSAGAYARHGIGNCNAFYRNNIMAHNTFNIYSLMLRIFKSYHFSLKDPNAKNNIAFSSRPGDLESKDDFYVLWESEMSVVETSFNNWNPDNFKFYHPESLPAWVRVTVASRLASTPAEWAAYFEKWRSGTHNNQWLITDFNQLFMAEEAFYLYKVHNFTDKYQADGYAASYNVPYDNEIWLQNNYGGGYGFNYTSDPRARQFKQYSSQAHSVEDMGRVIRLNKVTEEFDICNGAISPRCDLENGSTFGGIDAKVVDKAMAKARKIHLISSPSYQEHRPFTWSDHLKVPHFGMTEKWEFPWYEYNDDTFQIRQLNYDYYTHQSS